MRLARAHGVEYFQLLWHSPYGIKSYMFPVSLLRKQMEFHIIRGIFSKLYKLPSDFEFAKYAELVMREYILDLHARS